MKRNRVRCMTCDDVIESLARHHFITCKCGKVASDGGPCARGCRVVYKGPWRRIEDDGTEGTTKGEKAEAPGVRS